MKEREDIEGPKALENFEKFGQAILQAPKPKRKKQLKPATLRKPKSSDRD
jgi:hypothetical protein